MIGEIPEVIPALMELIRDGTDHCKKNALVTIFGLLTHPGNHNRALEAGRVPFLASLLRSFQKEDLITDSIAVFATLAERRRGAMAILGAGAIPTIVDAFAAANSKVAKEHCVSLCTNGLFTPAIPREQFVHVW
ncbi:hypothetical protein LIER_16176 [Lithospermum erythrorhizon]|uniref:Uncharacterized protein n=1 Tax=Lithospermum erythrorhizon TaxID=34254 RepID=A0AAV3Q882_LITER